MGRGSSPLARGLHVGHTFFPPSRGIIPARAGFTRTLAWVKGDTGDHPRSRGVYRNAMTRLGEYWGSSPLARGLLCLVLDARQPRGIIPARAGFTCFSSVLICQARDHPRSRGVYAGRRPGTRRSRRIIPARAGFTRADGRSGVRQRDHPRSRGVYSTTLFSPASPAGSSPLARGLPGISSSKRSKAGIIPARAGFTPRSRLPSTDHWDHPRSRGVYDTRSVGGPLVWGSSPLARGLQLRGLHHGGDVGIIPARAGFTQGVVDAHEQVPDHPRSRGVYFLSLAVLVCLCGSSPLARGLPIQ